MPNESSPIPSPELPASAARSGGESYGQELSRTDLFRYWFAVGDETGNVPAFPHPQAGVKVELRAGHWLCSYRQSY